LGYHYHVPVQKKKDGIWVHSYIGVFLLAIADQVEELVLFLHEEPDQKAVGYDLLLQKKNIRFESLGKKSPVWDRLLFSGKHLSRARKEIERCDALILRSPSPLSPALFNRFSSKVKCFFLIVGDYAEGLKNLKQPWYRFWAIKILLTRNHNQLLKALSQQNFFVNSVAFYNSYKDIARKIEVVNTSSITESDFYKREDTCSGSDVKLLYTGRFDLAKGLGELVEAVAQLRKKDVNVSLHLVGWEDYPHKPIENLLKETAKLKGIQDNVIFYGKMTVGPELNVMYRRSDLYVLPSYFEGFPRTIWEAMANSLPVVTTPVGGIAHLLEDRRDMVLTEVKNSEDLAEKIELLIKDKNLRQTLIRNGWERACEARVDVQTARMIDSIKKDLKNN
jgi:glycosyltransferase involved in cell wall biosynthesis